MKLLYLPLMFFFLLFNSYLLFSQGPELDKNKLKEIETFLSDKSPFEQVVFLDKFIAQYSFSPELYKMKARVELTTKDYLGVVKTVLTALKRGKEDRELLQLLAISYFNLNDLQKAEFHFKKVLEHAPGDDVALFYLALINPARSSALENSVKYKGSSELAELVALYKEFYEGKESPFIYLLDRTVFELDESARYSYTIHRIIMLNRSSTLDRFKNLKYNYDSNSFIPELLSVGTYSKDNLDKFLSLNNLDENYKIGGVYPEGYITFKFPELAEGSIIEFKIKFTMKKERLKQPAEHLYFTTLNRTLKKEYSIVTPNELKLQVKRIGSESIFKEEIGERHNIMSYTMINPPLLNSYERRVASARPGEELIFSTYKNPAELEQGYLKLFPSTPSNQEGEQDNDSSLEERVKKVYLKEQAKMLSSDEKSYEVNTIEETLRYHFERSLHFSASFIDSLNRVGIKAYPVLTPEEELKTVYLETPHPYLYNSGLVYIAAQTGFEQGFFLDISAPYIDYKNLSPTLQDREVLILKGGATIESAQTPVIASENNLIEESYRVELNRIGSADLAVRKTIKGSFATLLRLDTTDLTGDELIKHFLNTDEPLSDDFNRDDVQIEGYNSTSGQIDFRLNIKQSGFTEIFFDGKQILKEDLKMVRPLFNIPQRSSTPYIAPFLFTYKKSSEYIFPSDYVISKHNLQSFSRENRYLYFNFEPEKIGENHFIFNYEFSLKKREIDPADLMEVNIFINSLIEGFNIEVTMENRTSFDYDSFFEQLLTEYGEPTIYQGFIDKLLAEERVEKAEEIALKGMATFSEHSYFRMVLAFIYLEKGEYERSEKLIFELIDSDREKPDYYKLLINLYKIWGNKSRLEGALVEAYGKFPDDPDIVTELVNFYQNEEEYEKALTILKKRLEGAPEESKGRYYSDLGYIYFLQKNYEDSEKHFLEAIRLNENDAYALNNLAWLYCERGTKIDEAIAYALRACALEGSKDSFLDTLAEAYYLKGEYLKALEAIKRALELSPDSAYLKEQLDKIERAYAKKKNEENDGK